jgi:hypothetical protein
MGHILPPGTHPGNPVRLLQGFNSIATPPPTTPRIPASVTQPNAASIPVEWYRMTTANGNPHLIRGQAQAMDCLCNFNWSIKGTFPSLKEAELWKVGKESASSEQPPSGSDSDYKVEKWKKDKKKKRKRRKNKSDDPSDDSAPKSSSSSSSDSDSDSESEDSNSSDSSDDSHRGSRRSSKARKKEESQE